jgi:membrane AbrB-like protein
MRALTDAEFGTTTGTAAGPAGSLRSVDVLILAAGAVAGGFTARLLHAPAPFMIGPMFVTAALYVSGVIETRPPVELTILIQVVLGSGIGSRFAGATLHEMFRTFGLSIGLTFSLLMLVVVFAYGVSGVTEFEFAALVLAYTPGGIAEMGILALLLDIDPVFVSTHQTFRVMLIYMLVPILARRWLK